MNETAHFKKCKKLFEHKHLLLLRDIWWSKFLYIFKMLFIFSTTVLIRNLWQLKTVVFLHWCLIRFVLFTQNFIRIGSGLLIDKWFKAKQCKSKIFFFQIVDVITIIETLIILKIPKTSINFR